jgi:site-specific DNA recombinase
MKCTGYIRVSTVEAAANGHSLDAQGDLITAYAQQRGWELVEIYQDAGISGTRTDRPGLQRLLRDAAQNRFQVVIVHAIDRFYRNLQGLLKALNQLHKHDVAFISIAESIDFTTPWGKLSLAVLGTLAEIYIDKLSAEVAKGKLARARKGLYSGSLPLGYCRGN